MMRKWHYQYAGFCITSEMAIPEWSGFERNEPATAVDVRILLGEKQAGTNTKAFEECLPDEYRFSIPGTGEYRIRKGREIMVSPVPSAAEDQMRLFLLGSAWGALCYQRGILALHASVIQVGSGAVAFCGPSGAGKSTLAAWLVDLGHPLIADDLCCFVLTNGAPLVYPSTPRIKLWRDSLDALGWKSEGLARDQIRAEKFYMELTEPRSSTILAPLSVHAIYLIASGTTGMKRLRGLNSLRRLVALSAYRPGLINDMGKTGVYWEQCAELARRTPVWELSHPRDWTAMDGLLDLLMKQWDAFKTE